MTNLARLVATALTILLPGIGLAQTPVTTGPNGEPATPADTIVLSEADIAQLKEGGYTAAFSWHELYDWSSAVSRGAHDEFDRLGIKVVAETNASFDAARQTADIETVLALKPSILIWSGNSTWG